ncbi:hypothetical protein SOPP22_03660 [Shewanella sp. OPT22]|nr:hypothetical protein SOPP22_03660 [Shewanella sp. OPT22]
MHKFAVSCLLAMLAISGMAHAKVDENKVCLYSDPEYKGQETCFSVGQHGWVGDQINDKVSSIRLYGNAYAKIYSNGSFRGQHTVVMANTYKLDAMDDAISSLKVGVRNSNDFACLFEHNGFRGTPYCLEAGQSISDLDNTVLRRNEGASLLVSGKTKVTLFEYPNFDKNRQHSQMTRSSSNLGERPGDWQDENVDSFQVSKRFSTETEKAIDLTETLSSELPLTHLQVLASHNSFNSTAYFSGQLIPGPNHRRSLAEQLQLGVRFFELDVRRGDGYTTVCHSFDCRFSSFKISLRRLLGEVDSWLKGADPNDVVFFYLQDDMSNDQEGYKQLEKDIKWMGSEVYSIDSCSTVPKDLTLKKIRDSGARVFFYKDTGNTGCSFAPSVMMGNGFEKNIGVASINMHDPHFDVDTFLRSQECHNNFCHDTVTADEARVGIINGVNAIGLDMLEESDLDNKSGRLNKQLWAFGPETSFGAYSNGRTASFLGKGDRFMKVDWDKQQKFACREQDGEWNVSHQQGRIVQGKSICEADFPGSTFDVPMNPVEAQALRDKMAPDEVIHVNFGYKGNHLWAPGKWGTLGSRMGNIP